MDFLRGYAAFLDLRYWFNPNPVPLGPSLVSGILSFFVWFLVIAVALRIGARAIRKQDPLRAQLLRKFASPVMTTGLLGLLFLFFAYEQLPLFGMRFWTLFLFIGFAIWMLRAVIFAVKEHPRLKEQEREKKEKEKWLPGKRR